MCALKRTYSGGEYSVNYSLMGGVDFSSPSSISGRHRYSYLENMYRDYDGEGAELTESIPGFRKLSSLGSRINGFYLQRLGEGNEHLIIHSGSKLYRKKLSERDNMSSLTPQDSLRTVNDTKSCGFSFGKCVYVLDGVRITRIDENGVAHYVSDGSDAAPYVPTTYINGKEYEQLNLLTRQFREEYYVAYPEDVCYGSPEIEYRIIDKEIKKCAVSGVSENFSGDLYVPTYAYIGSERYEVERIDEQAFFKNTRISSVTIAEGIKEIGASAFSEASKLTRVALPDSVETIATFAFAFCNSLREIRFGESLTYIGLDAFLGCPNVATVKYAYSESIFYGIEGAPDFETDYAFQENSRNDTMTAIIPIMTPTDALMEIFVGEESVTFVELYSADYVSAVILPGIKKTKLLSAFVKIRGYAHRTRFNLNTPGVNFISGMGGVEPCEAINKCTVCECFDGRVFLSGNPSYPNTVFYSARDKTGNVNPLYFGVMNYFNDGVGGFPIISLLAAGDSLAVFKSGDDGSGSIFYHVPQETGIDILPKIYPVSYIHNGIVAEGDSISFFDDPVFISSVGVSALDKKAINLERSIACRSHNVNPRLLPQELSRASLAIWCGYLAVLCEGEIFLGDSRSLFLHETGNTEYEWYYLNEIGTYTGDDFVYEYIATDTDECETNYERLSERCDGEVYSATSKKGTEYFFTVENGTRYQVGRSEEKHGGAFNPATIIFGIDNELLFFGTRNGDVCIFNNDMRGIAPKSVASKPDFDPEAYKLTMSRSIHPDFYGFENHAPRYAMRTVMDDGGIPDMTKSTVKGSLTLKCKSFGKSNLVCEVGTNKNGYREMAKLEDSMLNFEDFDFNTLSFFIEQRITVPISEKEKGWIEKEISLYSNKFRAPLGVYSIGYRFRLKGKIKKTKL